MNYYAKLDATLTVVDVFTSNESDELNVSSKTDQTVRKTFKDGSSRKNFAGIGFTYDASRDAFIPPKPHASWVLNETSCIWESPVARPDDTDAYVWDEETTNWIQPT